MGMYMQVDTKRAYQLPPHYNHPDLRCNEDNANEFYDERSDAAVILCSLCPVRIECAVWAVRTEQNHGTWGGITATARRRLHARIPSAEDAAARVQRALDLGIEGDAATAYAAGRAA